jgi:site-specific DNA recombinase
MKGGPSLLPDADVAGRVREAFETVAADRRRGRELRDWLGRRGLVGRRGGKMSAQSLLAMLRNPIYTGRIEVPKWGISVAGDFEAVVSPTLFARAQARLAGSTSGPTTRTRNHPDFPLRRFVRCGACDRPLTGSWSKGRGARYAYYHCARCGAVRVAKADLEREFHALLEQLQPSCGTSGRSAAR